MTVSFNATKEEQAVVTSIAQRAISIAALNGVRGVKPIDFEMDIIATHANGCPLDLDRLSAADEFNFVHDVFGIRRHLNRETGKLENCFLPRHAKTDNETT